MTNRRLYFRKNDWNASLNTSNSFLSCSTLFVWPKNFFNWEIFCSRFIHLNLLVQYSLLCIWAFEAICCNVLHYTNLKFDCFETQNLLVQTLCKHTESFTSISASIATLPIGQGIIECFHANLFSCHLGFLRLRDESEPVARDGPDAERWHDDREVLTRFHQTT